MNTRLRSKYITIVSLVLGLFILLGFVNVNAITRPRASLKITRLDSANGYWNYRADYTLANLNTGSIKVNGRIFVDGITQSGTSYTGYSFRPGRSYTFIFYSKNGGRGSVLARKTVVPPKIVVVKNTPTPTSTPNPTPAATSTSTPITKNGFLLSGSLCTFDFSLAPQSENNARRLLSLCEQEVPVLESKFGRGQWAPPYKIQFYTPAPGSQGTEGDPNAYAGSQVYLSTNYFQSEAPYDAKILAHELTHVIQSFNTGSQYSVYPPSWLTEALADYGAYTAGYSNDLEKDCYHFSNDMQNQTHVYSCTYKFLKFIENKYDPAITFKLNKAGQLGTYSDNLWAQYTGKTFNQLLSECSQDSDCKGIFHGGLLSQYIKQTIPYRDALF